MAVNGNRVQFAPYVTFHARSDRNERAQFTPPLIELDFDSPGRSRIDLKHAPSLHLPALNRTRSLLFTTASIFFAGTIGEHDVLFLFGDADQAHEFALTLTGAGTRSTSPRLQFTNSSAAGITTLVHFADPASAATFWAPAVKSATVDTVPRFESFWQFGTNTTVLVGGRYLNMEPKLGGVAHRGISVYLTASVASSLVSSSSAVLGKGSSLSHIKQFNLQATSARRRPLCVIVQADGLPDTVVLGTHGVRVPRCSRMARCSRQSRSIPYAARDIGT
ncbi:hypothetical protein LXA43DRAFT_1105493 [Ganoderma leucocontextum]|nr:hypothetical protein LXA43DRAFT_1105493 [Ganoderma leucocontextum]